MAYSLFGSPGFGYGAGGPNGLQLASPGPSFAAPPPTPPPDYSALAEQLRAQQVQQQQAELAQSGSLLSSVGAGPSVQAPAPGQAGTDWGAAIGKTVGSTGGAAVGNALLPGVGGVVGGFLGGTVGDWIGGLF